MKNNKRQTLGQLIKYALVGCMNTMLTLCVIFLCKSVLGVNAYVSNALGYVVGLINSFLWNRKWVFRSNGSISREAIVFLSGFAVCYLVQFAVVWVLNQSSFGKLEFDLGIVVVSGYGVATLIGNVAYTLSNFVYNKLLTFKK